MFVPLWLIGVAVFVMVGVTLILLNRPGPATCELYSEDPRCRRFRVCEADAASPDRAINHPIVPRLNEPYLPPWRVSAVKAEPTGTGDWIVTATYAQAP